MCFQKRLVRPNFTILSHIIRLLQSFHFAANRLDLRKEHFKTFETIMYTEKRDKPHIFHIAIGLN